MKKKITIALMLITVFTNAATAQRLVFKDPTEDDNGSGKYKYPTDLVYKKGSFDLTEFTIEKNTNNRFEVSTSFNSNLEDPWNFGVGFSLQMIFIFIDTDGKPNSGFTEGLPGLNIGFDPNNAWDKVIILSPQPVQKIRAEVDAKAGSMKNAIVIPARVKGFGRKISATINVNDLGEGDYTKWSYQVVVQSNENFPSGNDLLTRKVNEYEAQHRFGGGTDTDCDPHVLDILAGNAKGENTEKDQQYAMLNYTCNNDGTARKRALLKMVRWAL